MHSVPAPVNVRCCSNSAIIVRRSEVTLRAKTRLMQCSKKSLFDHLVGAQQERFGDRQPERLGGIEVDHQLKLGRLLDRQIGRLGAAQELDELPGY